MNKDLPELDAEGSASLMDNGLERLAMHMFTLEMAVLENALVFLSVLNVPRKETRVVVDDSMKAIQVTTRVTGEARFCAPWDQPGWVTVHQQKWVQTGEYTFELRQEWNPC